MPVTLNIGLSRKIGEANFGSRGASVNLEVELENGVLTDPAQLRDRVRDLYLLARQSVEEELQRSADELPAETAHINGNGHGPAQRALPQPQNGTAQAQAVRPEIARATQSQIRAIFAITKRQGLDHHKLISERYRVHRLEDLSLREASSLIDELKNGTGVRP